MNKENFFGEDETKDSISFKTRLDNVTYIHKSPTENYQWAEIKSSLLVQELYNNTQIHKTLVSFLQKIVIRLFNILEIDYKKELDTFISNMKEDEEYFIKYPVSQISAFLNDKDSLWNDFYSLFEFLKWISDRITKGYVYKNARVFKKNPVLLFFLVDMFQQKTALFFDMIRGFKDSKHGTEEDDHIGISDIKLEELKRNILHKSDYKVKPWLHPGKTQCKVPFHGKYGTYMKKYKQDNDFYASLQCGISSSTQYIFYAYLLSISDPKYKSLELLYSDMRDIITTASLILIGDGGHNVREVIFGLVCTVIVLYNFIKELKFELQKEYENNLNLFQNAEIFKDNFTPFKKSKIAYNLFKKIKEKLPTYFVDDITKENVKNLVYSILIALGNWESIITLFYNETKTFNIVGVYKHDLDLYNVNISTHSTEQFKIVKDNFLHIIINSWNDDTTDNKKLIKDNFLQAQLFFSLDNNRFILDSESSFKTMSNSFIKNIIKNFGVEGTKVLNKVNKDLEEIIYNFTKLRLQDHEKDTLPPFAFSKKKSLTKRITKKKSLTKRITKKKSLKKTSIRKKSLTKRITKKKSLKKTSIRNN